MCFIIFIFYFYILKKYHLFWEIWECKGGSDGRVGGENFGKRSKKIFLERTEVIK